MEQLTNQQIISAIADNYAKYLNNLHVRRILSFTGYNILFPQFFVPFEDKKYSDTYLTNGTDILLLSKSQIHAINEIIRLFQLHHKCKKYETFEHTLSTMQLIRLLEDNIYEKYKNNRELMVLNTYDELQFLEIDKQIFDCLNEIKKILVQINF